MWPQKRVISGEDNTMHRYCQNIIVIFSCLELDLRDSHGMVLCLIRLVGELT